MSVDAVSQGADADLADPASGSAVDRDELGPSRALAAWQLIAGTLGLVAAFVLTLERLELLRNPDYVPSCSINPVLSCGSIMASEQAQAFGFPNPLIGLMAFPVVMVTGALGLARVQFPLWYRAAFAWGTIAGAIFVNWLIFVSLYQVGALCPYCMVVWVAVVPLAWYTSLNTFQILAPLRRFHGAILTIWFAVVSALIFVRFDYYWLSLF